MKLELLKSWAKSYQRLYAFFWGLPLYRKVMYCVHNRLRYHLKKDGMSHLGIAARAADMFLSLWIYGCSYSEYNLYGFSQMPHRERKKYIGDCCRKKYYMQFNSVIESDSFRNKYQTYKMFEKYYGRKVYTYSVRKGFTRFEEIVRACGVAIIKPATASGGYGVVKVSAADISNVRTCFAHISSIPNEEFIIEEYVEQVAELSDLHPSSLNTARIITILDKSGEPHIFGAFFRVGRDGNVVDNGASGGIICQLNEEGEIVRCRNKNGEEFIKHPNTQQRLVGVKIPKWKDALNLALELSQHKKNVRFCGWDLALTNQGWVLIEGNEASEFIGIQIFGVGCRKQISNYL